MKFNRIISAICVGFGVTACAVLPKQDGPIFYRSDVISSIQCELYEAVNYEGPVKGRYPHRFFEGWTSVVTLTLDETNEVTHDLGASFAIPLVPGILTVDGSGNALGTVVRTGVSKFSVDLGSAKNGVCPEQQANLEENGRAYLTGDLRITDEFKRLKQANATILEKDGLIDSHTYTTNFEVEVSGETSGKFSVIPIGTTTFAANFGIKGRKKKGHEMILTLTPPAKTPEPPEPTEVIIVGDNTKTTVQGNFVGDQQTPKNGDSRPSVRAKRPKAAAPNSRQAVDRAFDSQNSVILNQIQRERVRR